MNGRSQFLICHSWKLQRTLRFAPNPSLIGPSDSADVDSEIHMPSGEEYPQALSQPTHESDRLLSGITWPLFTDSPPPVTEVPVKTGVPAAPRCIPVFPGTLSETSNSAVCLFLPLSRTHSLSQYHFCTLRGNVGNGVHSRKIPDRA